MERIFISPSRYVQGPGVFQSAEQYLERFGNTALLVVDDSVWRICGQGLSENLSTKGIRLIRSRFKGEATEGEMTRLVAEAKRVNVDFVMGLGGGKTLDVSKGISHHLGLPCAILPTVASTDAATSAISVIYSAAGVFEKYAYYDRSPDLVLVDPEVIVQAPARLLIDGIADALATAVEMRSVRKHNGTTLNGGKQTLAAIAIAEACEATLFEQGLEAVNANQTKQVTTAFENVVEANILLSGLGFESGGLAGAHAIHNGFSAIQGAIHQVSHGRKVAYGLLMQLVLEECPANVFDKYSEFYQKLALPLTLQDIHLDQASYADLLAIGQQATISSETSRYIKPGLTAADIAQAFTEVNRLGTIAKKKGL